MEFSRVLVFWVVCVCLSLVVCEGALTLCSGNDGIQNGSTLYAEVYQPLTFTIQVCFNVSEDLYNYALISRKGLAAQWYTYSSDSSIKLEITKINRSALVTVTLSETRLADFNTNLYVQLTNSYSSYSNLYSKLIFVVFITPKETTPTTATTRTSSGTTIMTSSTCPAPTKDKPKCPPPMYLVEDGRCLQFIHWDEYSNPDQQCQKFNGMLSSEATISWILKCQSKISERKILQSLDYYIESTDGSQQRRDNTNDKSQFDIACVFDREISSSPKITSFYILIPSVKPIQLNNNSLHKLQFSEDTRYLSLVCVAAGIPIPQFKISHWEIMQGEKKLYGNKQYYIWPLEAQCENSGTYTCVANSSLGSDQISATLQFTNSASITKFLFMDKSLREFLWIYEKDFVTLQCEASGCPSPGPKLSLVNERGELLPASQSTNSITYQMTSVACSDMGRYYCRIQDETSQVQESQMELRIWNCTPQLCSQEQQNKTITSSVNQTVHISVCVISPYYPTYSDNREMTSVTIIKHENSQIYYTVNIAISNIQTSDSVQTNIHLKNSNGVLTYTFFLKVQDNIAPERYQTSDADFNPIYVGVPIGLLVLAVIIGVFVYRIKKKQQRNAGTGNSNFNYYGNDDNQVTYANIQDFRNEDVNRRGQCLDKVEMETCQYNNLTTDNTDLDSGRTVTGDGLVYVTLANTSKSSTKKAGPAKPSSLRVTTKPRPEEFVEYTSLDLQKTGQVTLPDDDLVKTEEELEVCASQDTGVEDLVE